MKIKNIKPPRKFQVGIKKNNIFIKDVSHIELKAGEKVKINNKDLSIKVTSWGFFIENDLLGTKDSNFLFAGANFNKIHLLSYKKKKKAYFNDYCKKEKLKKIPIKKFI